MHMRLWLTLLTCIAGLLAPAAMVSAAHAEPANTEAGDAEAAAHGEDHDHAAGEHPPNDHGHDDADHAHHAGPASNHPLSIDPDLWIFTLVVFLLLMVVMNKFAWGPILAGLAKRERGVADNIDVAATRRKEAQKMLNEYQLQLERAGEEVRAMLDGAKKDAETRKQQILEEASQAAAAQKQQATSEIESAKNAALAEIGDESVKIAFNVASRALHRDVNPADHQDLVAQSGL